MPNWCRATRLAPDCLRKAWNWLMMRGGTPYNYHGLLPRCIGNMARSRLPAALDPPQQRPLANHPSRTATQPRTCVRGEPMRLGKKPARIDANRLKLRNYLPTALPVPASADWTLKVPTWGMMLNDLEGDCVFAGGGHAVQTWTAAQGVDRTPPDYQVQYYYEQWAGYDPARPSTDQGYIEIDFLNNWRKFGYCGAILDGYADPDWRNIEHIKLSIALFGGVYIGVQLPQSAMDQFSAGQPWTMTGDTRVVGGHALWAPAYDQEWIYPITWGKKQPMAWDCLASWADEAHTLRSPLFLNAQGEAASRIDLKAWDADLSLIISP